MENINNMLRFYAYIIRGVETELKELRCKFHSCQLIFATLDIPFEESYSSRIVRWNGISNDIEDLTKTRGPQKLILSLYSQFH